MSHFIKWYLETYVLGCGFSLGNSIEIFQVSFYRSVTLIYIYVNRAEVGRHSDNFMHE